MLRNLLAACAAAAVLIASPPASAQNKVRLAASSDSLSYIPVYAAEAMGYFKQVGIDLDRTLAKSGPQAIAAVIGGDLDMVMGATGNPILANKAGGDIIIVGALSNQFGPGIVLTKDWAAKHKITAASSTKDKIASLKGARIVISGPGGGSDQLLHYLAEEGGLNTDRDMTIVAIGDTQAQIAAIASGRVDALSITPPNSNMTVRQIGGVLILNSGVGEVEGLRGYLGAALSARASWVRQNEALTVNFLKGLQMGFDVLMDPVRTTQARDAVRAAVFKDIDPEMFAELWAGAQAGAPRNSMITPQQIQVFIDVNNRFTKDKLELAAVQKTYTNEYVERALKK